MSKRRIYDIIEVAQPGDTASRTFDIGMMSLIARKSSTNKHLVLHPPKGPDGRRWV